MHLALVLAALALVTGAHRAHAWFPGVEQRYKVETLVDAGALGLPNSGVVAAFADYNADGLVDLVHLSSDQRSLAVYTWDRKRYEWTEAPQSHIRTNSDFVVTAVVPGDFNYDGRLDLLVYGGKNPGGGWWADEATDMRVYLQRADGSFGDPLPVDSSTLPQAIPLDATGDMRVDLLGVPAGEKEPQLWRNVWEASNQSAVFELTDAPFNLSSTPSGAFTCRSPSPHSNAFVDLDGDCLADLFLMCQDGDDESKRSYQIWLNRKDGQFELARSGELPRGTKSVGFADMDRDGTIDMVITACPSSHDCALHIAYNAQMPLCDSVSSTSPAACRDPEALCVADPSFTFDLSSSSSSSSRALMTTIPFSSLLPSHTLSLSSSSFRGAYPTPPQIGDFNIDGFPDLLVVAASRGGRDRQAFVLESRPCEKGSCTADEIREGRRAFRVLGEGTDALSAIKDVESAHWFDMDDDGSLDILVQRLGNTGAARTPVFIKNNYFHDAFFLKAMDGQLPQSTYNALGTPYSYFGLGRTNNYVENLFIGSTRHQPQHYINVEGLIPNSQVLILPFQPAGTRSTDSWTRMLFLRPGDWIPWVTIVLASAIIALGAVVVALHVREKREDEKERRARLLHLNFQAL
ncbi:hypothetical protein Rhopal_001633-T1 [Rhodotorula paludigena]|uniref:T-cell immunomodulatory protein TIP C2 domain-containing protein n=1 Tax=Rhodotorula paludigena TaxID=86838 RepID=A0AAV5GH63_9BASI|nr:hypothetical protein Rhopal_001633-T1 [Rhodotorula paludigena]